MEFEVFLSHSSKDAAVVQRLLAAIESAGVKCWIAPRNITLGRDWTECIEEGIKKVRLLLLILSQNSNTSPEVKREVQLAADRRIIIAPVVLGTAKPAEGLSYTLARAHRISIPESPNDGDVKRVVDAVIAALRPSPPPPPPPPPPARSRLPIVVMGVIAVAVAGVWGWAKYNGGRTTEPPPPQSPATPLGLAVPSRLANLPAAPLLKLVYESTPAAPAGTPTPAMSVGILARRPGQPFAPLRDGDSLSSEVDEYLLGANVVSGGYLYVFQVDSRGKVDPLFPTQQGAPFSTGENPVANGQVYQVPAKESAKALTLDRNAGVEHVYFVLSAVRWPELERMLAQSASPGAVIASVTEPNGIGVRGVGGMKDLETAPEVEMTLFSRQDQGTAKGRVLRATGPVLVVERWFRHLP